MSYSTLDFRLEQLSKLLQFCAFLVMILANHHFSDDANGVRNYVCELGTAVVYRTYWRK
jgi:hypothetical protein